MEGGVATFRPTKSEKSANAAGNSSYVSDQLPKRCRTGLLLLRYAFTRCSSQLPGGQTIYACRRKWPPAGRRGSSDAKVLKALTYYKAQCFTDCFQTFV